MMDPLFQTNAPDQHYDPNVDGVMLNALQRALIQVPSYFTLTFNANRDYHSQLIAFADVYLVKHQDLYPVITYHATPEQMMQFQEALSKWEDIPY